MLAVSLTQGVIFKNSTWCSLCVECFVGISEQTATFALYITDWLVFIIVLERVYNAVRTDSLCKADYVSSLNVILCIHFLTYPMSKMFCYTNFIASISLCNCVNILIGRQDRSTTHLILLHNLQKFNNLGPAINRSSIYSIHFMCQFQFCTRSHFFLFQEPRHQSQIFFPPMDDIFQGSKQVKMRGNKMWVVWLGGGGAWRRTVHPTFWFLRVFSNLCVVVCCRVLSCFVV